ncbi:MAG: Fic family protein [Clostridiales bacterium]|nr:Fic family protein [Clostridiales bacterium]
MKYISLKKYEYIYHGKSDDEYSRRFNSYDSVKVGVDIGSNPAFFVVTREIQEKALQVHKLDKIVLKLCNDLPAEAIANYMLLCLINEIQITNSIEGVHSTKKEILNAYNKKGDRFSGIVGKYNLLVSGESIPLKTCQDIRNLYDELVLSEVLEESKDNMPDGKIFRKDITYVRGRNIKPVHEGLFPEENIIDSMKKSLDFLNNEDGEILYRVAVFHYLFGYIHPFYDGNGRINRFISSYMLTRELEPVIGYSLSNTIKEEQALYNKTFIDCNDEHNRGELTMFVDMFLDILVESIQLLISALESRSRSWKKYNNNIKLLPFADRKYFPSLYKILILRELFATKRIDISELKEEMKISEPTVRKLLSKLDDSGLLIKETSERSYKYGINLDKADEYLN